MRNLLIFIMALSVLSCTKTEISDSYKELNEIKFEGFKMGNAIGSQGKTAIDAVPGQTFGVYSAYNTVAAGPITDYLINEELAHDGANWTLTGGTKYYPNDMIDMHFIGYGVEYNKNVPDAIVHTTTNVPTMAYANYDADDQSDLNLFEDFAITTSEVTIASTAKADPVVLNFTHALSKVKFTAQADSDNPADIKANIKAIRVNAGYFANLDFNEATPAYEWNTHSAPTSKALTLNGNESALTSTPVDIVDAFLYVIPNQAVTIEVDYELTQTVSGSTVIIKSETAPLTVAAGSVFNMNNSITYNLTVSKSLDPIIFGTPTIVDWTPTTATGSM
jgi:hypothetical protein